MGWRDALKSLEPSEAAGEPPDIGAIDSDGPEADWFRQETNGS